MRPYAGVWCAILMFCAAGWAQESDADYQHSWGCRSTQAESNFSADLNRPSLLQPERLNRPDEIRQAQAAERHILYSKINAAKFGISRVDFYFHEQSTKTKDYESHELSLFFRVTSASGESWWKLVEPPHPKDPPRVGLLDIFDGGREDSPAVQATVLPATGDRTVPIFDLAWTSNIPGMWVDDRAVHLLLDLRGGDPKMRADLACHSVTAFGVCGAWDAQQQMSTTYDCDWNAERGDFVCQKRTWDDSNNREERAQFSLMKNEPVPYAPLGGAPATLQEFAQLAERDPAWRRKETEIPGLGKTTELLRLPLPDKSFVYVFGTYSGDQDLVPRFLYVRLDAQGKAEAGEIQTARLFQKTEKGADGETVPTLAEIWAKSPPLKIDPSQMRSGGELKFAVKSISESSATHVYQVRASNGNTVSLLWLVVDATSPSRLTTSAALLASNASDYAGCAQYTTAASAAAISQVRTAPFRAAVDVEPSHTTSETSEGYAEPDPDSLKDECPYTVSVEWGGAKGWQLSAPKARCSQGFHPRDITIGEDGTLTAKPGQVAKPEQ